MANIKDYTTLIKEKLKQVASSSSAYLKQKLARLKDSFSIDGGYTNLFKKGLQAVRDSVIHRKRRREPDLSDDLIRLKRRKLNPEPSPYQTPSQAAFTPMPRSRPLSHPMINDSYSLYRLLVSPEDERDTFTLSHKKKLLEGALSYAQEASQEQEVQALEDTYFEVMADLKKYLSFEEIVEVENVWSAEDDEATCCQVKDIPLKFKDLKTLRLGSWVNDEVVNAYLKLRNVPANSLVFNSFFFSILEDLHRNSWENTNKLKRILRKQKLNGILDKDFLYIPVNMKGIHWLFVVINNKTKEIEYYDSLGDTSAKHVGNVLNGLVQLETGQEYYLNVKQFPKQTNGFDCGVFMLQGIKLLLENKYPEFESGEIPNQRKLMVLELKNQNLLS